MVSGHYHEVRPAYMKFWITCVLTVRAESSPAAAAPLGGLFHSHHRLFPNCTGTDLCSSFFIYERQSTLQELARTVWPRKWSVETTWEAPCTRDDRWFGPNNHYFFVAREGNLKQGLLLEFHLPSSLPVGFDSKAKTKMAADSVQVGKVDNCCEKCANFLQRFSYKSAKLFYLIKFSRCEWKVL